LATDFVTDLTDLATDFVTDLTDLATDFVTDLTDWLLVVMGNSVWWEHLLIIKRLFLQLTTDN
jgi:hypothetical protein